MSQPEAKITKAILDRLKSVPLCFAHKVVGGPMQRRGLPDIEGCIEGAFFGLEVKRPETRSHVSPLQARTLKQIEKAGGIAAVVTSVDEALEAIGAN